MGSKSDLEINKKTAWRKHISPLLTQVILEGSDVFDRFRASGFSAPDFVLKEVFNSDTQVQKLKSRSDFYLQKAKTLLADLQADPLSQELADKVIAEYVKVTGTTFPDYVKAKSYYDVLELMLLSLK
jgi:hypothetical protein